MVAARLLLIVLAFDAAACFTPPVSMRGGLPNSALGGRGVSRLGQGRCRGGGLHHAGSRLYMNGEGRGGGGGGGDGQGRGKDPDEAWKNAEEYDSGMQNPPSPPPYSREGRGGEEPYEFIRGGRSLFDEQPKRQPDSIRQAEVRPQSFLSSHSFEVFKREDWEEEGERERDREMERKRERETIDHRQVTTLPWRWNRRKTKSAARASNPCAIPCAVGRCECLFSRGWLQGSHGRHRPL